MQREFTYYPNGQLHTITGANTPWVNRNYTYDALDRLILDERPQGAASLPTTGYGYDPAGNRQSVSVDGTTSETYANVAGTNRLDSVSGALNRTYTYDANGNTVSIVSDKNRTYAYNQANELIEVKADGTTTGSYVYNGYGQRAIKTVSCQRNSKIDPLCWKNEIEI